MFACWVLHNFWNLSIGLDLPPSFPVPHWLGLRPCFLSPQPPKTRGHWDRTWHHQKECGVLSWWSGEWPHASSSGVEWEMLSTLTVCSMMKNPWGYSWGFLQFSWSTAGCLGIQFGKRNPRGKTRWNSFCKRPLCASHAIGIPCVTSSQSHLSLGLSFPPPSL